ncbi:hypothetical protein AA18890_1386 [Komagataeibacter europaeus LMG 18890]|nr:hypothetical protein AA18890_1386 [Komagataeibacter europaeus LMG 18890]
MIDLCFRWAAIWQGVATSQKQKHATDYSKGLSWANMASKQVQIFQKAANGQCNTAIRGYGE